MKVTKLPKVVLAEKTNEPVVLPNDKGFEDFLRLTKMKATLMDQGMTSTEAAAVIERETGVGEGERWDE